MKNTFFSAFVSVFSVILLSSCAMGLEPVWKAKENATISLEISAIGPSVDDSSSRAIIQGQGYLYIRTFSQPISAAGVSGKRKHSGQ
jgi:hypothetical protein